MRHAILGLALLLISVAPAAAQEVTPYDIDLLWTEIALLRAENQGLRDEIAVLRTDLRAILSSRLPNLERTTTELGRQVAEWAAKTNEWSSRTVELAGNINTLRDSVWNVSTTIIGVIFKNQTSCNMQQRGMVITFTCS